MKEKHTNKQNPRPLKTESSGLNWYKQLMFKQLQFISAPNSFAELSGGPGHPWHCSKGRLAGPWCCPLLSPLMFTLRSYSRAGFITSARAFGPHGVLQCRWWWLVCVLSFWTGNSQPYFLQEPLTDQASASLLRLEVLLLFVNSPL